MGQAGLRCGVGLSEGSLPLISSVVSLNRSSRNGHWLGVFAEARLLESGGGALIWLRIRLKQHFECHAGAIQCEG